MIHLCHCFYVGDGMVIVSNWNRFQSQTRKKRERHRSTLRQTRKKIRIDLKLWFEKKHRLIILIIVYRSNRFLVFRYVFYYSHRKCSITHVSVSLWLNKIVFAVLCGSGWGKPKNEQSSLSTNRTRTSHYYRLLCVRRAQHNKQIMFFGKMNVFGFRYCLLFVSTSNIGGNWTAATAVYS